MPPIIPFPNEAPADSGDNGTSNDHPENFMSDSDSLSEGEDHDGYEPLSQDPDNCVDNNSDLEEDSNFLAENDSMVLGVNLVNQHLLLPAPLAEHDSSDEHNYFRESLKMDEERIETIKSVMKGITLPKSNLPHWANLVPEEEWKNVLLTQMSSRDKSNSNSCFGETSSTNNENDFQNEVPR